MLNQKQALQTAISRHKINPKADFMITEKASIDAIYGEWEELARAQGRSPHLPNRSNFAEELADIVICCMTLAEFEGIPLETIIEEKMEYNRKRKD